MKKNHFLVRLICCLTLFLFSPFSFAIGNSIVAVDTDGTTGLYTSMVLDSQGYPTMSYYDATEGKLKVAHCFDKNCSSFNSITTPDSATNVGQYSSIALDSNGHPVVSYYDSTNSALKVLHCGTSTCSSGNTIATPDNTGTVGWYTSTTVDNNNFPVVSYYDATQGVLKVLHCGNAACTVGNTIAKPDLTSSNGVQSSVKMNSSGNPVVAYFDFTNSSLKILKCGNSTCTAANTIVTADSTGDVGRYPSMLLDASGNPAISYLDLTNGKLKVLRCGNSTCSSGNTFASIGTPGATVGYYSSLSLASTGFPVVSYYDSTNSKLNIVRCGNASCSSGNSIMIPDTTSGSGLFTSLRLDVSDSPMVSYYDSANGDLKVLHCGSSTCGPNSVTVADTAVNSGLYTSIKLDSIGNPVVSYWDQANGDLKLIHCGNNTCTANNTIATPATTGNTGWDTSLVLDSSGNPVVSYYDFSASAMKLLHCGNANCNAGNSINSPDVFSGRNTSLAIDASGNPIIASSGPPDQGLRVVHCGNATCSAGNVATSPDFPAFPFNADVRGVSLILDASGNPVISFFREDQTQLKVLHCADANCAGPGNSLVVVDPGADAPDHRSTAITLDASGNPVVAYQDSAATALKVLHCGNANCTSSNTIASLLPMGSTGYEPSIRLDASGNPIVSYGSGNTMSVVHCGNASCTAGNTTAIVDSTSMAADSSLVLDASGSPVISYQATASNKLKVAHCATPSCQ